MSSGSDPSLRPNGGDVATVKEHLDEILEATNVWVTSYQSADRIADEWFSNVQRAAPDAWRRLQEKEADAQRDAARRTQEAEQQAEEAQRLTTGLAELREDEVSVKDSVRQVERAVREMRESNARARKELEDESKVKDDFINLLKAMVTKYRNALGLRIQTGSDGSKCTFTLIDPLEPQREFYFVLFSSKEEHFVKDCQPPVAKLPELLDELNKSNDLSAFFKGMRNEFRTIVTGGSSR